MSKKAAQNIDRHSINSITITEETTGKKLASDHRIRHATLDNSTLTVELGKSPVYGYIPTNDNPLDGIDLSNVKLMKMINHTDQTETTPMKIKSIEEVAIGTLHFIASEKNPETEYKQYQPSPYNSQE